MALGVLVLGGHLLAAAERGVHEEVVAVHVLLGEAEDAMSHTSHIESW